MMLFFMKWDAGIPKKTKIEDFTLSRNFYLI